MDEIQSAQLYQEAVTTWEVLRSSFFRDEPEWQPGIYKILADLERVVQTDPAHLAARELRIRLIGDELGACVEAFEEADELVRRAPQHTEYQALRERMQQCAKAYWPETPDQ